MPWRKPQVAYFCSEEFESGIRDVKNTGDINPMEHLEGKTENKSMQTEMKILIIQEINYLRKLRDNLANAATR